VLIGITTGGKVGLGGTALVLIVFALAASFLLPRRNPDFPGERLRSFIALSVVLFVAVVAAVVFFAAEEEEEGEAGGEATPTLVETGTTGTTTEAPAENEGDPKAGESVFAEGGCSSCHTLEAAGASGNIGPNLDESQPDTELVVERVTNGMGTMPSFSGQFNEQQIQDVAAYVVQSTSG